MAGAPNANKGKNYFVRLPGRQKESRIGAYVMKLRMT